MSLKKNELKNKGIDLRLEDTVTKINGDENNFVKSVTTEKGEIPADTAEHFPYKWKWNRAGNHWCYKSRFSHAYL